MFVIDVITFAKSAPLGSLSYRTSNKIALGSLVEVPLRRKTVLGIVVGVQSVQSARALLRKASYTLRSGSAKRVGKVPPALMESAQEVATYHASTLGAVLSALLPEVVPTEGFGVLTNGKKFEERCVESMGQNRLGEYRATARVLNARGEALLVVAPSIVEAERLAESFRREASPTTLLTGQLRGTKRSAQISEAVKSRGVVVATPSFLGVPIVALGAIVLDRESAGGYVAQKRPYVDWRIVARALARARSIPLILGDYPLRIECRVVPEGVLNEAPQGTAVLLDVRKKETDQKTAFRAVSEPILRDIQEVVGANGRVAVFAVRKGYAPAVVCRECGATVKDERGRALALVGTASGKPVLRSSDGATLRDAKALCDVCGSWNLAPLGVGVERVALELAKAFPTTPVIRFDAETVKTPAQARTLLTKAELPGTILVATEAALPWITGSEPFDYAAIASADSLLALPFWRSRERLAHLGLTLRQCALRLVIATRRPEDTVFTAITDPTSTEFFAEEATLRKALGYPPYITLLTFVYEGTRERVASTALRIAELLAPRTLTALSPRLEAQGRYRGASILKLPAGDWPSESLSLRLVGLPPSVRIRIDPESLW
jgi:primosomal protein N' (replication factor Y)